MLQTLRIPVLAVIFSLLLLGGAIFIRFVDDSNNETPRPTATASVLQLPVNTPTSTSEFTTTTTQIEPTAVPVVLPATSTIAPVPGQLTEGLIGSINKLNPLFTEFNPVDRDITSLVFEGLTTINSFGESIPLLAERWDVSRDGLEYVFLLRRDILWHDGTPFTSADVRYTIDAMRDNDFPGDTALRDFWRTVELTVIDDFTLRFRLVQPLASFPEQLKRGILPAHILSEYPVAELDRHPFNLDPIGTGPYQVESLYSVNGRLAISLRVAPVYRQRVEGQQGFDIDRILFRTFEDTDKALDALTSGEINSIGNLPVAQAQGLNELERIAIHSRVMPTTAFLIYNWNNAELEYLANTRLHQAFALSIDRRTAVTQTLGGIAIPAESPLIPGMWAYDNSTGFAPLDFERANTLLQSVSFDRADSDDVAPEAEASDENQEVDETATATETVDPPPEDVATVALRRDLTILVVNEAHQIALADSLGEQISSAGFTIQTDPVTVQEYRRRLEMGDFDMAIVEYSFAPFADPDPYTFWHISQAENGVNYAAVNDIRINDLLERARRISDGNTRAQLYQQFQQRFIEQAPALPLYHPLYIYVVDDYLDGVRPGFIATPADRFLNIAEWRWNPAIAVAGQ